MFYVLKGQGKRARTQEQEAERESEFGEIYFLKIINGHLNFLKKYISLLETDAYILRNSLLFVINIFRTFLYMRKS